MFQQSDLPPAQLNPSVWKWDQVDDVMESRRFLLAFVGQQMWETLN